MRSQRRFGTTVSPPATTLAEGYFHSDPKDRLLLIQNYSNNPYFRLVGKLYVDIALRTFASYIESHPASGTAVTVPWQEWGPHGSRVTRTPTSPFRSAMDGLVVNGLRRVELRAGDGAERAVAVVFDYHPRRVARARARQRSGDIGDVVLHDGEMTGLDSREAVRTVLPCIVVEIPLPEEVSRWVPATMLGVWLTEDGLVFAQKYDNGVGIKDAWAYIYVLRVIYILAIWQTPGRSPAGGVLTDAPHTPQGLSIPGGSRRPPLAHQW
ncbi:hypothetical protein BV25DRAFT_1720186 [Artomyces pyxidatus]|uniref:Uncharacterized protein n=1 Tax=Artomyces pyxidatus TaxID=48021 RepID=A0ACB8SJE6_9AGAM|nr:hypothetical protein BV25DRAFT_1720186 [Artomyces pyxidatus]